MSSAFVLESPLGLLPPGWRLARLKEITTKIGSGATPLGGSAVYRERGTAFVRSQNVHDRFFSLEGLARISDEHALELDGVALQPSDVLLNITGDGVTFGRACLVPNDLGDARVNQHVAIVRVDQNICHPGYLLSFLTHPLIKQYIESFNAGGSRRAITKGHIESFVVPLPPLDEQEEIAEILGSLDDKIDLNRRMNQTLEEMAQALFRSWFVDFDPVRTKAERRQPEGMDSETAVLFPSRFVDSELGKIPEGWRVTALAETCSSIFSGGTPHTQSGEYWGGGIPWLSSGETRSSFIIDTEKTITTDGVVNSSTRLARSGCTVIASAGQGHTRGQTSLLALDSYINQSVIALKADPSCSSDLFLFFDLKRRYEQFRQLSDSHSSRGSLTTKLLGAIRVLVPPLGLVSRYDAIVGPLVARLTANLHQSRTLTDLRDTLLPKLLSGEIRVREAETQLAAGA